MTKSNLFKVLELYWLKLSNIGITKGLDVEEVRKIILLNRIFTLSIGLVVLLILKSLAAGLYQEALIQISFLPFCLFCYYLNYIKKYNLARIFAILCPTLFLLGLVFLWGEQRSSHFIFYSITGLVIVFFEKRIFIFIFWVIIVLAFLIAEFLNLYISPLFHSTDILTAKLLNIIISFLLLSSIINIFKRANYIYQNKLRATLEIVEKQNQKIASSIKYARQIQNALLPLDDDIKNLFKDYFIFYKPRDIVSGDFYFFLQKNDKIFCAIGDCTGHGVPGAFMSILGINLLTEIIEIGNIIEPDKILDILDKKIKFALHQKKLNNSDSIDIALAVIDQENKILEYSGAKLPLLVAQNDIIQLIKGDNQSIGGKTYLKTKKFTKHVVDITQPTTIYMYSDGFQDQIGGKFKQKFRSKNLRNLLYLLHKDPFEEQKKYIEYTLKNWQEKNKQIDDILIIGLQIS